MRFVFPYVLTLCSILPLLALIWLWMFRRSARRAAGIAPEAPAALRRRTVQLVLVCVALALLIVASSRPQWGMGEDKIVAKGRNVMVALDVSRSMLARDVHPNRLERAKTDILDLVEELDGDRAALLAFRGKGQLLCPLTSDYAFFRQALDGVSPESAPRGETDVADALTKALAALDPAQDEYSAILLISDGGDLKGRAAEGAKKAAERGIPVFTVGIGSEQGAAVPDAEGKADLIYQGKKVTTRLEGSKLKEIADISGGRYIALGTAGTADTTLGAIYRRHLRAIAAKEQREAMEMRYRERFQLFLIPGVLLFLCAAALSRGRLSAPGKRTAACVLALCALQAAAQSNETAAVAASTNVQDTAATELKPGREGAREAQRLFADEKWSEAAAAYRAAAAGADREEAGRFLFNAAVAESKAGNADAAVELLQRLTESKETAARAGALAGKLLVEKAAAAQEQSAKAEALAAAALAFQAALRDAPDDEAGNRNLTRALDRLPEARENAKIDRVLKEHQNAQPSDLLNKMLAEQRKLRRDAQGVFAATNAAELIAGAEALAKRQESNEELWIALKAQLLQAVTNENDRAEINRGVELCRKSMQESRTLLEDVAPVAREATELPEAGVYAFWKMLALPPALIDEDLHCQTNAIIPQGEAYFVKRDAQSEALELTKLFRQRFPQWAEQYVAQAAQNTNMPPFSAEDRAKIEKLAGETEELQTPVAGNELSKDAKLLAHAKLEEIKKLLPKQNNSQSGQPPPEQQNNENEQQQQQQQQQNEQQQNEQQQQDEQRQDEQKQPEQPQKEQAEEILRRALEREKEHEQQKKERMRAIPASPLERDW